MPLIAAHPYPPGHTALAALSPWTLRAPPQRAQVAWENLCTVFLAQHRALAGAQQTPARYNPGLIKAEQRIYLRGAPSAISMAVIPKDHKSLCKRKQRDIRDAGERGDSGGHGATGGSVALPSPGGSALSQVSVSSESLRDPHLGSLSHPPAMCRGFRRGSQPRCLSQDLFQNLQGVFSVEHGRLPVAVVRTLPGEMLMT